jgi:hypothetical protein
MNLIPIFVLVTALAASTYGGNDESSQHSSESKFAISSGIVAGRETRAIKSSSNVNNNNPKFAIGSTLTVTPKDPPEKLKDCITDGKQGNPGAQIRFTTKALDEVYKHAMETIVKAIKEMNLPDVMVPLGGGILSIKDARIVDAKLGSYVRQLVPADKTNPRGQIKSCMRGGRIVSVGDWTFKSMDPQRRTMASGVFRTIVINPELNVTNEFARRHDGKPMVETKSCLASLKQFRIEIDGFGDNTTVIEQCDNIMCSSLRNYFQSQVCERTKTYINQFANLKLATWPSKIRLGPSFGGNRFVLDYTLLKEDWPRITNKGVQTYLEGEVLSRGSYGAPFNAVTLANFGEDLDDSDDELKENDSMMTFKMSDYAFNTLFYHAHTQQFKYSAIDLIPSSSSQVRNYLKMRCVSSKPSPKIVQRQNTPAPSAAASSPMPACLGAVFENNNDTSSESSTDNNDDEGYGDLVFKSQRPLQVVLDAPSYQFGVDGGLIEAYGSIVDGKRELLGRADVQWIRGEFTPKLDGCNITGSVMIHQLQLGSSSMSAPAAARIRSMSSVMLDKLAQLAKPVFVEMFNSFLDQFAQFPIPLVEGLECESPKMEYADNRTMQVRSEIRVTPEATRIRKQ